MGIETAALSGGNIAGATEGLGQFGQAVGQIGGPVLELAGGYLQGQSAEKQAKKDRALQIYLQRQQLYSQGAFAPTVPLMKDSLGRLQSAYDTSDQYINPYAGGNEAFTRALQLGLDPTVYDQSSAAISGAQGALTGARQGYEAFLGGGGNIIDPTQISSTANTLLNNNLIDAQVDAYSRDISRNLGETTSNIRAADVASGNLGSSRGGVQEAIARRAAEDRIADFRGGLAGNALTQAQNILEGNIQRTGAGYGMLGNLAQAELGGAGAALDVSGKQLSTLGQLGQLQQGLSQAEINNAIAERDFALQRESQFGKLLRDYASVGNLPRGMA